jgi:hypothetical protein
VAFSEDGYYDGRYDHRYDYDDHDATTNMIAMNVNERQRWEYQRRRNRIEHPNASRNRPGNRQEHADRTPKPQNKGGSVLKLSANGSLTNVITTGNRKSGDQRAIKPERKRYDAERQQRQNTEHKRREQRHQRTSAQTIRHKDRKQRPDDQRRDQNKVWDNSRQER